MRTTRNPSRNRHTRHVPAVEAAIHLLQSYLRDPLPPESAGWRLESLHFSDAEEFRVDFRRGERAA